MAVRTEVELYEAGLHDRKIAELVPQEDGRHALTLPTEFGSLSVRLGEPVAEPAPAPAKSGKARAKRDRTSR